MFLKLLEQQFNESSFNHKMKYRFPVDFAVALSVHVNHLNRFLKAITGKQHRSILLNKLLKKHYGCCTLQSGMFAKYLIASVLKKART